jgi:shikimate dehydrogenase
VTRLWVIGRPIAHSLSPIMHGAALAALGSAAQYGRREVAPDGLAAFVDEVRGDASTLGFNVTLPYKVAIAGFLDRLEASAVQVGAVNTVVREGGALVGLNTDAEGLARSLREAGIEPRGRRALVIGAGGAARAALVALEGAERRIAARDLEKARALVGILGIDAAVQPLDAIDPDVELLVQASSASLDPQQGAALAARLPLARLPREAAVVDLVYRPRRTAVLAAAEARDLRTVDGTGMLVHQGALALERWLGVPAPVAVMRAALTAALDAG